MKHLISEHCHEGMESWEIFSCLQNPITVVFWIIDHFVFYTHFKCNTFFDSNIKYYEYLLGNALKSHTRKLTFTNRHIMDKAFIEAINYGRYTRTFIHDIHYLCGPYNNFHPEPKCIYTKKVFTIDDLNIDFHKAEEEACEFVLKNGLDRELIKNIYDLITVNEIDIYNHTSFNSIDKLIKHINNDYKNSSKLEGVI